VVSQGKRLLLSCKRAISRKFPSVIFARILQLIAEPLGFHPDEPLILTGYLSPEPSVLPKEQSNELRAELNMLLERVVSDRNRIREIVNRLLMTS